jgi:Uma2 family endonuclease
LRYPLRMAEQVKPRDSLTVDEYLKLEESATVRHEYVGGEIFAMVDATKRHNTIIGNISGCLWGPHAAALVGCILRASSCASLTMSSITLT